MRCLICFHAVDADGYMSALVAKRYCESKNIEIVDYLACNFDKSTNDTFNALMDRYLDDDLIVIVGDFTFPDDIMTKYAKYIWHFDHHKPKLEPRKPWRDNLGMDGSMIYYPGREPDDKNSHTLIAGCECMFYKLFMNEGVVKPMFPTIIHACGRHDVFDLSPKNEDIHTGLIYEMNRYMSTRNISNVTNLIREGWFDKFLPRSQMDEMNVFMTIDDIKRVGNIVNKVHYNEYLQESKRAMRRHVVVPDLGEFNIVAINRNVTSGFFKGFTDKNPEFNISITYHLDQTGKMLVSCRSLHDNAPALEVWKYIERRAGLYGMRKSMGGHMAACGGSYDMAGIMGLHLWIQNLTAVK